MTAADFAKRLLVHAQLTRFELTPEVLDAYDRVLAPKGYDRVCAALDCLLTTRGPRDGFPSLKEILSAIDPQIDESGHAVLIANRVYAAISAHGWPNAKSARGQLGDEIWSVIQAAGGWASVCADANEMDPGTFKAQLRELAKAKLGKAAGKASLELTGVHAVGAAIEGGLSAMLERKNGGA